MFKNATFAAQITDNDYNVKYSSKLAKEIPSDILYASEKEAVNIDENTRLKNASIRSGHFLWLEDVSAFNRTLSTVKTIILSMWDLCFWKFSSFFWVKCRFLKRLPYHLVPSVPVVSDFWAIPLQATEHTIR